MVRVTREEKASTRGELLLHLVKTNRHEVGLRSWPPGMCGVAGKLMLSCCFVWYQPALLQLRYHAARCTCTWQ